MKKIMSKTICVKSHDDKLSEIDRLYIRQALAKKIGMFLLKEGLISFEFEEPQTKDGAYGPIAHTTTGTVMVYKKETIEEVKELLNPSVSLIEMSGHRQLIDGNRLMQLLSPFKTESNETKEDNTKEG